MQKILTTIQLCTVMLVGMMIFAPTASATSVIDEACKGPNASSVICQQQQGGKAKANKFIQDVISTLLFVLGAICVIVIIIGGIRYATSGGDSGQIKSAKDTILYAVIGLVVALLAYAIVRFVLNNF